MSTPRQEDLTIITKAKDLVNETMRRTACKFPKRVRFTLANRMDELALQILHDIIAANEIFPKTPEERDQRRRLQTEVLTSCKMLLTFMDIALEQQLIDHNACEYWAKKVLDVKNMAAAWRKKDADRFK
ncbi:MAG: four helix bundle protein [Oscillibacter sp.]